MLSPWILFPLILVGIGVGVAVICFAIFFLQEKYSKWGANDLYGIIGGAALVAVAGTGIIALLITAFPYNPHYWVMEEHSGKVVSVSNQFNAGSGDKSDTEYVVELEGSNIPYLTDDSRILSFKTGDNITLNCVNIWVYTGTDTTDCSIKF